MATLTTTQSSLLMLALILLSLTTSSLVLADCRKLGLQYKLARPGCRPVTLDSVGCRGTCSGYTRISPNNYLEVERSCTCCQEMGYLERTQRLQCPTLNPPFRDVTYRIPRRCSCRPCRSVASVSRVQTLEDLRLGWGLGPRSLIWTIILVSKCQIYRVLFLWRRRQ